MQNNLSNTDSEVGDDVWINDSGATAEASIGEGGGVRDTVCRIGARYGQQPEICATGARLHSIKQFMNGPGESRGEDCMIGGRFGAMETRVKEHGSRTC